MTRPDAPREPLPAEGIIADLLSQTLMQGHESGRRHLYIWEAKGLAWLASNPTICRNAWTADCVRAYANNAPILPGWSAETYPIAYVLAQYGATPLPDRSDATE